MICLEHNSVCQKRWLSRIVKEQSAVYSCCLHLSRQVNGPKKNAIRKGAMAPTSLGGHQANPSICGWTGEMSTKHPESLTHWCDPQQESMPQAGAKEDYQQDLQQNRGMRSPNASKNILTTLERGRNCCPDGLAPSFKAYSVLSQNVLQAGAAGTEQHLKYLEDIVER